MALISRRALVAIALLCSLAGAGLRASSLVQFNLADLVERSDRIYRATVVEIEPGTVQAGGGEIPIIIYRVRVEEGFKGNLASPGGNGLVEIRMVNGGITRDSGGARFLSPLPRMPTIVLGESYLLFTTQPSAIGLSTTVGLGQGCFHLTGSPGQEQVLNEFNNLGLFSGMENPGLPPSGSFSYPAFSEIIRTELTSGEGN